MVHVPCTRLIQVFKNCICRDDCNFVFTSLNAFSFSYLQEILREGDTDHDGELNFEEFALYLQERERKLLLMFHSLDHNHDGMEPSPIASVQPLP